MTIWPQGYALARHVELDSTNSEACRLAQAGERGPLWIMTERQSAGRGRRGRQRRCATRRARRGRTSAALILLSTLSGLLGAGREGVVWFVVGRA